MNMRDYQNELLELKTQLARKEITHDMELFVRQVQNFASDLWARCRTTASTTLSRSTNTRRWRYRP